MNRRRHFRRRGRWALAVLVVLLALGHACMIPAAAEIAATPDRHVEDPPAAGHEHDPSMSCEPIDGVSGRAHAQGAERPVAAIVAEAGALATADPARPGARSVGSPRGHPGQRPLFVLFATLLI